MNEMTNALTWTLPSFEKPTKMSIFQFPVNTKTSHFKGKDVFLELPALK